MPLTVFRNTEVTSRRVVTQEISAVVADSYDGDHRSDDELIPRRPGKVRSIARSYDIVDEWGMQSFPASDPPANW